MEPRPFFETAPVDARRRALLVSYSYPPDAHVGALRWQKLSQYFAERGWALDVVTLDPAANPKQNPASLADLPPGVRIFIAPHPELPIQRAQRSVLAFRRRILKLVRKPAAAGGPSGAAPAAAAGAADDGEKATVLIEEIRRAGLTLRSTIAAYHARVEHAYFERWGGLAEGVGRALAERTRYDVVLSSGPPHVAHDVARRVARAAGAPLVVDLRDPWSLRSRISRGFASMTAVRLTERHERRVLEAADLVVVNTDPMRETMQRAYPQHGAKIITIMNGADDEALPHVEPADRFTLAFAGTIYFDRNPRVLFRALRQVVERLSLTPADLAVEMVGHVETFGGVTTRAMAQAEGVSDFVHLTPRHVPRQEVLAFLARSHILLTLPQDSPTQVPAKLFEYMNFDAWLLVHTPPDSAIAGVLRGTGADVLAVDDVAGTAAVIERHYQEFRAGLRPRALNADGRFSRRTQALRLVDAVEALVSPAATAKATAAPGTSRGR